MFFTKEDFRKIEDYLRLNSKKDSDFDEVFLINDNDKVVILLNALNKAIKVNTLVDKGMKDGSITASKLSPDIISRFESLELTDRLVDTIIKSMQTLIALALLFPHVVLTLAQYNALTKKDPNTFYFIVDQVGPWTFGGTFPIILSGDEIPSIEEWKFGDVFPIKLC